MKKLILGYEQLSYIFELKDNIERYIESGEEIGRKGSMRSDLPLLLAELNRLETEVKKQIEK